MDVHKESITVYLICPETGEVLSDQVPNERERLLRAARRWSKLGELRLCCEASGAGFVIKRWLDAAGIHCEMIAPRVIVDTHLEELDALASRREGIDRRIAEIAQTEPYRQKVQRLMSLRGIGLYSAMVLLTEIGDVHRFGKAPHLMSYFGLVPREDSTGDSRRRGKITKAGSSRARWILTEAAWNQSSKPGNCQRLKKHRQDQPAAVVAIGKKAE